MKKFTESQIQESIKLEIKARLENYKNKVMLSTGSFHDKNDVCSLLDEVLSPEFISIFIVDTLVKSYTEETETDLDGLYSMEEIQKAFDNMNFDSFVTIDNDSAEFQLDYNNRVELVDVPFEVDDNELIEELEAQLNRAKKESNNQ
jgi:hypothetical protein